MKFLTPALVVVLTATLPLSAQVTINEINAAPNERALRWDATGQPRLGTGLAWFDTSYDATSWLTGTAPLGFNAGNLGLGTNLKSVLEGNTASLYVRKIFNVSPANAASTQNLRLKVDYNDGFVAFLNGKEIARARLGAPKMFIFADQPAFSTRPSTPAGAQDFNLGSAASFLVPGDNVLAIQVANVAWDGKGDLKIDAGLELNNGILTTTEFTENFNNANGAFRTHTNTAGTITDTITGTPPAGWLTNAANPTSDAAWTALTVKQTLLTTGGTGNTGNLQINLTGTGALQPARVEGPPISMATQWAAGAVTEADLDNTVLTFKYKAPVGFSANVVVEPVGGAASAALPLGGLTGTAVTPTAEVAGYWRFEDHTVSGSPVAGTAGSTILNAPSLANPGIALANLVTANAAKYSTDVPGARILDPLTGAVYANTFSFDATLSQARFSAPNNAIYDTPSFTVECWMKLSGEPTAFDSFARRFVDGAGADSASLSDRQAWQLDYNHDATAANYGRIRSRWDTIGNTSAIPPVLLDNNRTVSGNYIFVDTPSGDGIPGNYGAGADVYTLGNQANDTASDIWHHIALTYDGSAKRVTIYTDYVAGGTIVLNTAAWVHPAANLEFGKFTGTNMPAPASAPWTLKMDEFRYTGRVLSTAEMLKVAAPDAAGYSTFSTKLSAAPAVTRTAFLAALNGASSQSIRPALELVASSYAASPGKDLNLEDFSINYNRQTPITPFVALGSTYSYKPGTGEPSNGIWEPNLPKIPNNPSEAGKPAAFPDLPGFADWIELRNSGATDVNLTGWYLSDDGADPTKWAFPAGTTIPAGGYRVVFCDENSALTGQVYLHTNFKLSEGGEKVRLYQGATQVDMIDYPRIDSWHSYGRSSVDGTLGYFDVATPAANNGPINTIERCKTPDLFAADGITPVVGGFYTGTQTLVITTPTVGATIRYTTDGSEPTEASTDYTAPLSITAGANDKTGRVIRARSFKAGAFPSGTKSATFLVDQNAALKGVPALCFTGDGARNFYKNYGILAINGGVFDGAGVWTEPNAITDYNMGIMHGRAFERPLYLEWLRSDGQPGFGEEAGVRLASSPFSRPRLRLTGTANSPWAANATEKSSFNIFFREDYDKSTLEYPFLGQEYPVKDFDQLRPRAGKNDISNPFIKDELVRRMFNDMGHKTVKGQINTLYVNGSYKGFYNTVERYREPFFQAHFDSANPWDIRIIDTVEEGDNLEWNALITSVGKDLTVKANYDDAMSKLVLDEVIDYYLLNIYCGMWDWPNNNWVASRERIPAGRWRLHVWDAEGSFGHGGVKPPNYDTILTDLRATTGGFSTAGTNILFRGLYNSPEVKLRFADRINKWFFNNNVLDDRIPTACPIQTRKDEMRTTFAPLLLYTHSTTYSDAFWTNWTTATTANPNTGTWTTAMSSRRSHLFNQSPTPASNISFRAHSLWPSTEPVIYSQHGGVIPPGYNLTIFTNATVPVGSTIYYTTDGTDPRTWGGTPAASALSGVTTASPGSLVMAVPGTLFTTVSSRVKNVTTGEWSALTEATFQFASVPATASNLVINQIMYHPPDATPAEIAAGFTDADAFEYLELMAIGSMPVSLDNVKVIAGVSFDFGTTSAFSPVRALTPGGKVLLVNNKIAFRQRYGASLDDKIGGQYLGSLSNAGEQLWITGPDGADLDINPDDIKKFNYFDGTTEGWPDVADGHGSALQLINPTTNPDHALPASWNPTLEWGGSPASLVVPVTFATWLDAHFSAASLADPLISGPDADPDQDGLSNLVEFLMGSVPDNAASGNPTALPNYVVAPGPDTLNHLTATFTVSTQALQAVTAVCQAGSDLAGWTPLTALPPTVHPNGTTTLNFRDDIEWKSAQRRFVRFHLTTP
jgi:hypothetical protein